MATRETAQEISLRLTGKVIERVKYFIQIERTLTALPSEKGLHVKISGVANPDPLLLNILSAARDELAPGIPLTITNEHKDYYGNV